MCPLHIAATTAGRYDQGLRYARHKSLPADAPRPCPTSQWPPENVRLLEKYAAWLLEGGTAEYPAQNLYLPMAGHILGLNPVPHAQINLGSDLEKAMQYVQAKGVGAYWLSACRNGLEKFKRFLRLERGLGEPLRSKPFDVAAHTQGLPAWLVSELQRYQRIQQKNWRPARFDQNERGFWNKHGQIWRFLCLERGVEQFSDLKRQYILDYIDHLLQANYALATINTQIHILRSFLLFLQQEGCAVHPALLRVPSMKLPEPLPKYLTDEQVRALRLEIECALREATNPAERRQALLDQALFYLLWQGGLRVCEVEDLRLDDLDLAAGRLNIRNSKGMKDRTIYLAPGLLRALREYLAVRGQRSGDHVFLYRNAPLEKSLVRSRLKTIGIRAGVKVHPHRLRHTCGSQLLNAGCRITSIQAFLGHKKISTTMIYARAHDQTVADDYFAAMERVEQRLQIGPEPEPASPPISEEDRAEILRIGEQLADPETLPEERVLLLGRLRCLLSPQTDGPANEPPALEGERARPP